MTRHDILLIARSDIELESIPNERKEADTDLMPAALRGAGYGGAAGLLAGLAAVVITPIGLTLAGAAAAAAADLDIDENELALVYRARGMDQGESLARARRIVQAAQEGVRRAATGPVAVQGEGCAPQVAAAQQVLDELGVDDVAIVGLAKRLEEVWVPGDDHPVILARNSEALYLLQRLRDESHRFANTFHRERRSKSMTRSALDGIPGLGESRRKALLTRFGSVKRIRAASAEELASTPGIGPSLAARIAAELSAQTPTPAVNLTTGEVLDEGEQP